MDYIDYIHSLKLTVRTCQVAPSQKETIIFQPSIFRCKLAVSFREGKAQVLFPAFLPSTISGFALSSLETTLKNSRNPESPRVSNTWQSLGLILSMVTVGANMVPPQILVLHPGYGEDPLPSHGCSSCRWCLHPQAGQMKRKTHGPEREGASCIYTVDGSEIPNNHLGYPGMVLKTCKTGAEFLPSTVSLIFDMSLWFICIIC